MTIPAKDLAIRWLPEVFRTRGGMGTHWMMPNKITLNNPNAYKPNQSDDIAQLDKNEIKEIVMRLHDPKHSTCPSKLAEGMSDVEKAWVWACTDTLHKGEWCRLARNLGSTVPDYCPASAR